LVVTCDVMEPAHVAQAVSTVIDEFGQLDILVNNAGGFKHVRPALHLDPEDWNDVLKTNLESVYHFNRAAGEHMISRGSGAVINVASIAGTAGFAMAAPNAAAKAGVISLTRTLGAEWARHDVRVNALIPGWVDTKLTKNFINNPDASDGLLAAIPMRRWGSPEDMVGACVFLASDAARLVTGTTISVDGGLTSYAAGPTTLAMLDAWHASV
jgi:2-deoxy-D-gluconate 3-dehydrogenase